MALLLLLAAIIVPVSTVSASPRTDSRSATLSHFAVQPILVSSLRKVDRHGITAVSCAAQNSCAAIDTVGDASIYNGTTWSAPKVIDAGRPVVAVSGYNDPYFNVGGTGPNYMAIDASGHTVSWVRGSWSSPKLESTGTTASSAHITIAAASLSCLSALDIPGVAICDAGDSHGNVFAYSATQGTWKEIIPHAAGTAIRSISCFVQGWCRATNGSGSVIEFYSISQYPDTQLDGSNHLTSISCAPSVIGLDSDLCATVDNKGNAFVFTGNNWQGRVSTGGGDLVSVSCEPDATFCAAVNAQGSVLIYSYSTKRWSSPVAVDRTGRFTSISCPTSLVCQASDDRGDIVQINPIH